MKKSYGVSPPAFHGLSVDGQWTVYGKLRRNFAMQMRERSTPTVCSQEGKTTQCNIWGECSAFPWSSSGGMLSFPLVDLWGNAQLSPGRPLGECSAFPWSSSGGMLSFPLVVLWGNAQLSPGRPLGECSAFPWSTSGGMLSFPLMDPWGGKSVLLAFPWWTAGGHWGNAQLSLVMLVDHWGKKRSPSFLLVDAWGNTL